MEKINRKSFVVYFEWFDNIGDLPPENFKELIMAIQEYAKSGIEPKLDGVTLMAFKFIKGDLERDLEKYIVRAKANRTNGLLGGRPKTEQNPTEPTGLSGLEPKPKKPDNVDDNDDDNGNDNDNVNEEEEENEEIKNLRQSEFFKKLTDYFSQNTERLERGVFSFLVARINNGEFEEFKRQTLAYIEYKSLSKEIVHRWTGYSAEWKQENWIDKLSKIKTKPKSTIKKALI